MPGISVETADTIEELAEKIGIDPAALGGTVREFNESIDLSIPWDPTTKDGRVARVVPSKSNWSAPLVQGPFYAFAVTCGITFTFGGLRITPDAEVIDSDGRVIPGLYAAGELVGGIFFFNYPGGSGLMNGSVFGRIAGTSAGRSRDSLI